MNRSAVTEDGSPALSSVAPVRSPAMEDELDLGRYLRMIFRGWPLIIVGAVLGGAAGVAAANRRPILYEAVTTILIGRSNTNVASATSRALLENRTIAAQTLADIGLPLSPQGFVSGALVVEQVPGTNVMKVKVTLGDPVKAAQASRSLSQKAVELNRRIASEEGSAIRSQLKALLDQAADRLKGAEEQYVRYQDQAQVELLKKDTERMIAERGELLRLRIDIEGEKARLAAAEQEIQKQDRVLSVPRAVAAEAALQRGASRAAAADSNAAVVRRAGDEIAALTQATEKPLPSPMTRESAKTGLDDLRRQQNDIRSAPVAPDSGKDVYKELDKRFAAQSAAAVATQDALEQLAASGRSESGSELLDLSHPFVNPVYQTLAFQIVTSRTRLAALERQQREMTVVGKLGGDRFGELSTLYRRTGELARLENNLDLARRIYGDLTVKYEQSRAESVGTMVQLQVVDEAVTPEQPLPRKRTQSAALGLTAGLVLGGLAALAWGSLTDRATA
jgi:uncharacterized protein involved in exopolysaccharide biosynthesis